MRKSAPIITQHRLKELLRYDADTGHFHWNANRRGGVKAGDIAGCGHAHHGRVRWQIVIDRKHYKAHQLAWLYMTGDWPNTIDHINGDPSDNRFCNLRIATPAQNMANSLHPKGGTGVRGVSFYKNGYMAQLSHKNRSHYIGRFKTLEEAKDAWNAAAVRLRGEFVKLD